MDPDSDPPDSLRNDELFSAPSPDAEKGDYINYYGCAVWLTFYRYGWLYIHEGYLAFEAPWMMYGKFIIRYEDMASLTKQPSSLTIKDRQGEELVLYLLRNPEETHRTIEHLWQLWISRLAIQAELEIEPLYKHEERVNYRSKSLKGVSDVLSTHRQFKKGFDTKMDSRPPSSAPGLFAQVQTNLDRGMHPSPSTEEVSIATPSQTPPENSPQVTPRTSNQKSHLRPVDSISSPHSSFPSTLTVPAVPSTAALKSQKYLLEASITNTAFLTTFNLPSTETLLHLSAARIYHQDNYVQGSLLISAHFLCYKSAQSDLKLVLPFYIIKSISEPVLISNRADYGVTVQTDTGAVFFSFDPPAPTALWRKLRAILLTVDASPNISILSDSGGQCKIGYKDDEIFKKVTEAHFGPTYKAEQKKLEKKWWKYFNHYGIGVSMLKSPLEIQTLLSKGGIPDTMRGSAWKILSGVTYKALVDETTYESIVEAVKIDDRPTKDDRVLVEQLIELDLRRSMPEHPYYQSTEGIDALRRVLTAYAYRNPLVSYCQGMNFIVAALLLYMSESDAFWTLAYLCEDVFPELWRPRLFGVRVAQGVLDTLLEERMPELIANSSGYSPTYLMLGWIPTFLVGRVPLEYSLRMLDHIFYYGADALYWMIYSTFELIVQDKGPKIPLDDNIPSSPNQSHLDTATLPYEKIFQLAFSKKMRYETLPSSLLKRIQTETKMKLVHELLDQARKTKIEHLANLTKNAFAAHELEMLYTTYHSIVNRADLGLLSFEAFLAQYSTFFSAWLPQVRLFRVFQASMNAYLGNRELKHSSEHAITSSLFASSSSESLSSSSSSLPVHDATAPGTGTSTPTHTPTTTPQNWNFVRDLFDALDTNHDGYLSIEEWVQSILILFKQPGPEALSTCLKLVDENHDGVVSHVAHRCALGLFLLLVSPRSEQGELEIPQTVTREKISEWLAVIAARASSQSRSDTSIEDIVACSFGDVLNIFTFFNIDPTATWKFESKLFGGGKLGPMQQDKKSAST